MSTYKLEELAREADVSPRTVRYYVQRGLLPPPDFKGSHTTYGPAHLLRLKVIKRLQAEHLPLEVILARVSGASLDALQKMLSNGDSTHEVSGPGGGSPYRSRPVVAPGAPPPPQVHVPFAPEAWERIELMPGLEVHVKGDASPLARRVAREIQSYYGPYAPMSRPEEK